MVALINPVPRVHMEHRWGADEVKLVKEYFNFDPDKSFVVADDVLDYYRKLGARGEKSEDEWNKLYSDYKAKFPELAAEYEQVIKGELPQGAGLTPYRYLRHPTLKWRPV